MKTIIEYIRNETQRWLLWASQHPIKSTLFSFLFGFLGPAIGIAFATERLAIALSVLFVAAIAFYWFVILRDNPKVMVPLLIAALCVPVVTRSDDKKLPQPAVPVAAAVVVVVVGGVTYIYLRNFCQRHFPKPAPPNTNAPAFGGSGDYAASFVFVSWVSCDEPLLKPSDGTMESPVMMLQLTCSLVEGTNGVEGRIVEERLDASQEMVDAPEFERLVEQHGIRIGTSIGQSFFGRNGRPSTQADVPIDVMVQDGLQIVSVATSPPRIAALERSMDLKTWQTLTTIGVGLGQQVRITDVTLEGQMFYRFREKWQTLKTRPRHCPECDLLMWDAGD